MSAARPNHNIPHQVAPQPKEGQQADGDQKRSESGSRQRYVEDRRKALLRHELRETELRRHKLKCAGRVYSVLAVSSALCLLILLIVASGYKW